MPAPIALRLALRQWLARPLRPILCSLAIAAAVALIVCIGAGFDSLRYSLRTTIGQMLGVADLHVRPSQKSTGNRLPDSLLEQLRQRPDVELAAGRLETHVAITAAGGERQWFDAVGVDPRWDERLRPKTYSSGHALTAGEGNPDEITIDSNVAEALKVKVGDKLSVSADGTTQRPVTIVGIAHKPPIEFLSKPTVFLPLASLVQDRHAPAEYNVIDLKLRDSSKIENFDAYAEKFTRQLGPTVLVSAGTNSKAKLNQETRTIQIILSLVGTIAAICAALIIGTTLSVGVQERVRQFGQLRCIGASRFQLVTFLLGDALVMLAIGEIVGILLGFLLSRALVWYFPNLFLAYKITASSLVIAVIDGCVATFLGALIPIWQITRVSPMAAVAAVAKTAQPRLIWLAASLGLACLLLQQLLWFAIPARDARFYTYMIAGIPLVFLGWALLGPAALALCEWTGAAIIGRLLAVRPTLLRNAWSSTPWRAGAMIAALMIGVTLFTTVRARGQSLLASWVPAHLPDLLIYSEMDVLPIASSIFSADYRAEKLKSEFPQIADFSAVNTFPVKMKTSFAKGGQLLGVDGPHFVAVDPLSFPRLVEMEYLQGNPATALPQLAEGRHIFVSKEFYDLRGLGVSDKLTLIASDGNPVEFTIAAVVTSANMELVKNFFDMRSIFRDHAVADVIGTGSDARKYFRAKDASMILLNLHPGASPQAVEKLRDELKHEGYSSVSSVELKNGLRNIITRVVDTLSIIALGALLVASLGVANMVIASVHARRYEFGVLRAIGSGRGQLIRLVLAEVTLIGIVAGVLGAAAGLYFCCMAAAVDRLLIGFQTQFLAGNSWQFPLNIAGHIALAILLTTLLAWLASILPAARGAFSAQRTLLASGRG